MTSPQPAFGDYQLEIYLDGLQGVLPSFPMAFAELEARAERALPPSVLSYVAGGAGSEHTQRANVSAFAQWGLIPRMFVGATRRDLSVELFGMKLPSPLLMAPIGVIGRRMACKVMVKEIRSGSSGCRAAAAAAARWAWMSWQAHSRAQIPWMIMAGSRDRSTRPGPRKVILSSR
jgi:isopentenyl diphosphate isomerase/L-lactate dehydrogenase-like FMN-dependent dehydrogenase